jgi:hypothetical protein
MGGPGAARQKKYAAWRIDRLPEMVGSERIQLGGWGETFER